MFLYLNLLLSVKVDSLSCSFTSIAFLTNLEGNSQYSTTTCQADSFLVVSDRVALHVDVHVAGGHIYWCDYDNTGLKGGNSNGIRRIKQDGTGYEEVIKEGMGIKAADGIRGITIDWIAGKYRRKGYQ